VPTTATLDCLAIVGEMAEARTAKMGQ